MKCPKVPGSIGDCSLGADYYRERSMGQDKIDPGSLVGNRSCRCHDKFSPAMRLPKMASEPGSSVLELP